MDTQRHIESVDWLLQKRLIGTRELALFLNFSPVHIRRLAAAGKLPPPRAIGGRKLGWKASEIYALLDGIAPKTHPANSKM